MDSMKMGLLLLILACAVMVKGNLVFEVHHKYGGRSKATAAALGAHDWWRHRRMLDAVDFQLGGHQSPATAGLYYTKITIGTPPVEYHVHVDTGSDILWLNCHNCDGCPTKSDHVELKQYDFTASSTGKMITCEQDFCDSALGSSNSNCQAGMNCGYAVTYLDGSRSEGYFVTDTFRFDQVIGNLQTSAMNRSMAFGCSTKQAGESGSSTDSVDGIIGFGQANSSIISQLTASGKVKKIFSHCLDGNKGGGIFALGEVVQPNVNRTSLVPNKPHYNVNLKSVEVGGRFLNLSANLFDAGSSIETTIDSGATLALLPSELYRQLLDRMMSQHQDLRFHIVANQFTCFGYSGNVDDGFPVVKFHFEGSLVLPVKPSNYLFRYNETDYCIGWQNSSTQTGAGKEITLLGDIVLSDKLVVYDLENQTIGWTEYNCSSSIRVRDAATGNVYTVASHDISSASSASCASKANFIAVLLFVVAFHKLIG